MPDLLLLRHAEAVSAAGLRDLDRPLSRRGRADAAALGRRLRSGAAPIEAVLVSPAARARQTLAALALDGGEVTVEPSLYGADADDVAVLVEALAGPATRALVIAHNPALQGLAAALLPSGDGAALDPFPPLTLAWLRLPAWTELTGGRAALVSVERPGGERPHWLVR